MKAITRFVQEQLCPAVFNQVPQLFPEHAFIKVGGDWHSKTYLNGLPHRHRSDKTVITHARPDCILEQGGPVLSIVNYVMQRDRCSFIEAVRALAEKCGLAWELERMASYSKKSARIQLADKNERIRTDLNENERLCTLLNGNEPNSSYQIQKREDSKKSAYKTSYFYHQSSILEEYRALKDNHLVRYLEQIPGWNRIIAENVLTRYQVGTAKKPPFTGSPIFWRISCSGKVAPSKIMRYDSQGRRVKTGISIRWTSTKKQYAPAQNPPLFYGLPLLEADPKASIALVESEKTALIASVYLPEYIWLATGGSSIFAGPHSMQAKIRMQPLKGRSIVLFPDLDKIAKWQEVASLWVKEGYEMHINSFVEQYADFVSLNTADLADFFAQINLQEFH